ncbi:MAG: hypothetical protein LBK45_04355 [Tannerellaceae bacterium]|jgi:hypothetical protein|nr:hypothetical protein [Tannerellaceae bacterium]
MTVLELQAKKAELAKCILALDDESIINKLSNLYSNLTNNYPCDYSIEEVAQACREAIRQHKEGKTIPLSDIKHKVL